MFAIEKPFPVTYNDINFKYDVKIQINTTFFYIKNIKIYIIIQSNNK